MNIRPIKSEADYQAALEEVDMLFDASPNTARGDKLDILTTLIEVHEEKLYQIDLPDPIRKTISFSSSLVG